MIRSLTITGRVILDATVQLFEVLEVHEDRRLLGFWCIERHERACYYLREHVGWCDDRGPLSLHDARVLMLSREAIAWRNREGLDAFALAGVH